MCGNTKQRIAAALRQLMNEKPFDKITVRNLMDATNMKRQSFYYHFRDTRDVLMWICRQNFIEPMRVLELPAVDWVAAGMRMLAADRSFYRKAMGAVHEEFLEALNREVAIPRIRAALYPGAEALDDNRAFLAEFIAQALTGRMIQFVISRRPLDEAQVRERMEYLLSELTDGK
ncbi:MAG: TetR family transcriptional regulator [Oscillospiraceae bacterium]|nr:TetR family transcriptional regulator [Oscillospiraceae bacterium]MBQ8239160.1 TetR family transcriptional regulator [Oscillospiraceae bacterium]